MQDTQITGASNQFIITEGVLKGDRVIHSSKTIGELKNIFKDEEARAAMDQHVIAYRVQAFLPVAQGTPGGLFFGTTWIEPGTVNGEYFMTQGHFHKQPDRAEYYWGLQGEGLLLLMGRNRTCSIERMQPDSLHYIPDHTAHRVVNTGAIPLVFSACWPADAGYDYEEIIRNGFSVRVFEKNGKPEIVKV